MFSSNDIVCAIELGTSKISVLIGKVSPDDAVDIVGRGCVQSQGIIKGEITDAKSTETALNKALEEAESSCGELMNCKLVTVLVTGCAIDSQSGVGNSVIKNPQRTVTMNEIIESEDNAEIINLASEREIINKSTSYYLLDNRRVSNPENMTGSRLEAHVHLVHGISSRISNFIRMVQNCGFENTPVEIIFSPLAASYGIVTRTERENGVLLIDFGMGCTEYAVEFNNGTTGSGVLQIGFDHIANDLAIGLELPIDTCRRLLESGELAKAREENRETIDLPGGLNGGRRIPLASFETIIDMRLRETFEIIRAKLIAANVPLTFGAGVIATGGGSLYHRSTEIIAEVFNAHCQCRVPADLRGAFTGLNSPKFSASWGALKYAADCLRRSGPGSDNALDRIVNGINRLFDNSKVGWRNIGKSMKF
ncbi:MAG: cell division protein FtsA [Lentisphaeria bacterium]|nr:cell division protein FtsA [Lentisphaeria bacterium]MBQ7395045.1 cell division protein FtsA [Lentisphaeria bacterium]MBR7120353.1 cell division protein FtsA [Lentisphaeria bacterium]